MVGVASLVGAFEAGILHPEINKENNRTLKMRVNPLLVMMVSPSLLNVFSVIICQLVKACEIFLIFVSRTNMLSVIKAKIAVFSRSQR